jgi:hypothetical protein
MLNRADNRIKTKLIQSSITFCTSFRLIAHISLADQGLLTCCLFEDAWDKIAADDKLTAPFLLQRLILLFCVLIF